MGTRASSISRFRLRLASDTLMSGGVIAYPTEAVWGLGCDPTNTAALKRLIMLKQRDVSKGLILAAANLEQLLPYIQPLSAAEEALMLADYGHAVSWIVPAAQNASALLTGGRSTICVRVSTHPLVAGLCEEFDSAVISTSANRSSQPAATTLVGARQAFGNSIDYYLAGPTGGAKAASEIRDLASGATMRPMPVDSSPVDSTTVTSKQNG